MSKLKTKIIFLLVTCYLSLITAPPAQAQSMSNQSYIIRTDSVNAVSETTSALDLSPKPTPSDLGPVVSEGVNFRVKAGFKNLKTGLPFSASLSSNIIDFGTLGPTNPIIRTIDLSTNSQGVIGYSVIAFEDQPLTATSSNDKTIIPDTTCDFGDCSTENSTRWTNALTYGFGYRCDNIIGNACDGSFVQPNFYKHFPDLASNDDPQSVISGLGSDNQQARLSYKVNISGSQAQGTYSNTVTYIAVPNF